MKAQLIPIDGGTPIDIIEEPQLFGRTESCDVRVDDASVSSSHCIVARWGDRVIVRDLGSKNGTRVNGQPVKRAELKINDILSIAVVRYRVHIESARTIAATIPMAKAGKAKSDTSTASTVGLSQRLQLLTTGWGPGAEVFEECRLVERIGEGGFGEVWKAEKIGVGMIAVKRITVTDPVRSEERALRVMKGLRHRFLARVYGCRRRGDVLVVAMELGEETLDHRFHREVAAGRPGIPMHELLTYMRQVAEALDYLYFTRKLLHRDVKPSNILIVRGVAKLCDFGLAKVLANSTGSHSGIATFDFAPPEYFDAKMEPSSDQFSLAATYCYLLAGQRPFPGPDVRQIAMQQVLGKPIIDKVPDAQQAVVVRALTRDPNQRFPSCSHFVIALTRAIRKPQAGEEPDE